MFSESDMRIMLSATRLMQRSSLQMHISLSLSPTLQEHLNSVTPAKIAQPSKGSGSGTLGAIIGRSFRNFSVSVGRVVYETSKNTLLDGRPISECGWKTCHVFSFRVVLEGVFICRFICTKCNWHNIQSFSPMLQGYIWSVFKCVKLCDSAKFLTFAFLTLLMLMFVFKLYARKKKVLNSSIFKTRRAKNRQTFQVYSIIRFLW